MSGKKVTFGSKRPSQATATIDHWVENRDATPAAPPPLPPEEMKRLTIDVPVRLHTRIKSTCAIKNLRMCDEIRELLEQHFPDLVREGA